MTEETTAKRRRALGGGLSGLRLLPGQGRLRIGALGVLAIIGAVFTYYAVGMLLVHRVDDDPSFEPPSVQLGASRSVAVAAALVARETDIHEWTANDPFFFPGSLLDNMPNFQQGIIYALSRFAIEMSDHIGRTRGSSEVDADLDRAAGLLKYSGTVWVWDPAVSWAPTAASETQYRAARKALQRYNDRLADGDAIFEARADNLMATLDRIAADVGSSSATIDKHLAASRPWFADTKVDDIFYNTKGRLYAYYLILKALETDYENVIRDRELGEVWKTMLDAMREASSLSPWVVMNGDTEGIAFPNHLATQGFYLLRARTTLREITSILAA